MIGDSITITLPVGGAKVLNKINQDGYTSEYFLKEATQEFRMKVRHTTAKAGGGLPARDRHNVELTTKIYATESAAEINRKVYIVFENVSSDSDEDQILGLVDWIDDTGVLGKLFGWQS